MPGPIRLASHIPANVRRTAAMPEHPTAIPSDDPLAPLYDGSKSQCPKCGWRTAALESHMDGHFRDAHPVGRQSRQWFEREWPAQPTAPPAPLGATPADDDQPDCALCGQEFPVEYDQDLEEWMCPGVVVATDPAVRGRLVHRQCLSE